MPSNITIRKLQFKFKMRTFVSVFILFFILDLLQRRKGFLILCNDIIIFFATKKKTK